MSRTAVKRPADRRKLILYATLAIVLIAIVVAVGLSSRNVVPQNATESPIQSNLKVGDKAPEFAVQTDAGPFDLDQTSGPVLLEVFATWCPHCQRETTVMNDIAKKYQGKIAIVAVSGDAKDMSYTGPESQVDVNRFAQTFNVRYPVAFDPDLKVAHEYLRAGFPTLVLIDKNKKVAWETDGETPESAIVKAINSLG
ncbi:MAG TPA: TlpA family protein disulfide reductase [Candidatus Baltobacteraceae bacterium]|nr:TlpA family protein disulfide reductase [Candidatus Baltobacteraceae bacterium]